jgi:transposase
MARTSCRIDRCRPASAWKRSGAHHWARLFLAHGHTVRLMAPGSSRPYRLSGKRGKNDAADAAAICEAAQRRI